ncbi:CD2 antigen cytoplasmic tail-binding protein 2 isoform X2 [Brachypodium distachyon]|uniref:OCRE domain-containing protein n=1 Tax=Brachypodium distachyon TaxID=15368 RepID=I1IPR8_BRADI|nr:CD2 antigen cytoplasmic tail-binding protein 2 isoform X2 [Brachypodium distachyon]KQJ90051.1 hypothetical protein BRADI_4g29190v3 [Brachypodium distachyon]|eukprot:XP_010238121.1 CD2 antigen cytoplasmic tail-binding protein 2 isoform X2 [Brachypodium distachyon]
MEPTAPQRGTKRPLLATTAGDDDDGRSALEDRRVRFPKGKKAKYRDPAAAEGGAASEDIDSLMNPELAAVRRARRRHRRDGDDTQGTSDVKGFEMRYKDDANFIDDGIQIEPFNLEQEREEGYFDENGNFVEFARGNDMKDAWLDNVEVDTKYAEKVQKKKDKEEEFQDLSSDDIGVIKRRIANMLEPAETIIQALKRLKNTSTDQRGKMTEGTKRIFDELTEAAMKLMENGEYNVYSDDRETFVREAEGYERLARARLGIPEVEEDMFADTTEDDPTTSSVLEMDHGPSAANTSATTVPSNDDDSNFDMFGDNDNPDVNCHSDAKTLDAEKAGNGSADSDYVYDPSSGYSYDEQSGTYNEMQGEQTGTHKEIQGDSVKE